MNIKKAIFAAGLKAKKVAPHVMVVLGIGGAIYTVVDACIRSRKLDDAIEEEVKAVEAAGKELTEATEAEENEVRIKEKKKEFGKAKRTLYKKILRYYLKTIVIGSVSIILIGGSHAILSHNLAIATTTLLALESDFKDYRNAVKEKYGEEAEQEIMYGRQMEEREITSVDEETGEEVVKTIKVAKWREGHSVYAMAFCKSFCGSMFTDNTYYDNQTLQNMIDLIDRTYEGKGYAFLDKAYEYLHHPITKEIIGVGWMKGAKNSDGYIHVSVIPTVFEFTPGEMENGYIVDFNVDGHIASYFGSVKEEALTEV